jgi:phosphomannomutase
MHKDKALKKSADKSSPKTKKPRRRKKPAKIVHIIGMNMDEVYVVINNTQLKRVEQQIVVDPANSPMIENILKDCQISFKKQIKPDGLYYTIQPPPEKKVPDETFVFPEDMPDELIEEGFCF